MPQQLSSAPSPKDNISQRKNKSLLFRFITNFFVYVFIFAVSFIFFLKIYGVFRIRAIEVLSERKNLNGFENIKKYNLLFISTEYVTKYLIELNPQIRAVRVIKSYPSTIRLDIEFEQSVGQMRADTGYFVLNENGKILSKTTIMLPQLPVINYYQQLNYVSFQTGEVVGYKDVLVGLFFIRSLGDLNIFLESIDINGLNMLICNSKGRKILVTTEKDLARQEYELRTIVKQFKIEAKEFKILDVRFDKPIVTF